MHSLSVIIPAHNEGLGLIDTVHSIFRNRTASSSVEIVIADDCSSDGSIERVKFEFPGETVTVVSSPVRLGVAGARNLAARVAKGEILFITDGHVEFCEGWDKTVLDHIAPDVILAATITDVETSFSGYGCRLVVPFMGTHWNVTPPNDDLCVQIASSAGTVIAANTFHHIGGFDQGMRIYGGAEPEFSVRAWLSGMEIRCLPSLQVGHRFKSKIHRDQLISSRRTLMVHNNLRFGLLYLNNEMALRMIRLLAWEFPAHASQAFKLIECSDVFERRSVLTENLVHSFDWFVNRFAIRDQAGEEIPS